jgi:hypothetical protein
MQVLSTDLKTTRDIYLVELLLNRTVQNADLQLAQSNGQKKLTKEERIEIEDIKKEALDALGKFEANNKEPMVTIGYIPPRKMTSLKHRLYIATRDDIQPRQATQEHLDEGAEIHREHLRWSIRGMNNLKVEYTSEEDTCGPQTFQVATWETVGILEGLGLMPALFEEIMKYNSLDAEKKSLSSSKSGMNPSKQTATSAETSQR